MTYSPHQLAYFAHQLTRRAASNSMDRMAGALLDAQVDLNPHQIDAALFATSNPLSKGATRNKGAATLADKLQAQKEQRDLEGQRDKKRRELFDRQDQIQARRDSLIDELGQQVTTTRLFAVEWELL